MEDNNELEIVTEVDVTSDDIEMTPKDGALATLAVLGLAAASGAAGFAGHWVAKKVLFGVDHLVGKYKAKKASREIIIVEQDEETTE